MSQLLRTSAKSQRCWENWPKTVKAPNTPNTSKSPRLGPTHVPTQSNAPNTSNPSNFLLKTYTKLTTTWSFGELTIELDWVGKNIFCIILAVVDKS